VFFSFVFWKSIKTNKVQLCVEMGVRGARKMWLMTYGASSPSITSEMLCAAGFAVKECYTLTQREFKYTLLRLSGRVYRSHLAAFGEAHGIIEQSIPGYDSIAYNPDCSVVGFQGHPGLSLIIEHLNTQSSAVDAWIAKGGCLEDGMLGKQLEIRNYDRMTKVNAISKLKRSDAKYNELLLKYEAMEQKYGLSGTDQMGAAGAKGGSASTHTVLTRYRRNNAMRDVMKQTMKLEKQLNSSASDDGSGEIYAAWNPLMPDLYKLGFTFRDAETRVKELRSAGVLEPFTLVRHAKVPEAR
jgi:hypothetical protein